MKKGRPTPAPVELTPAQLAKLDPALRAELTPDELDELAILEPDELAGIGSAEIKAMKRFNILLKYMELVSGPSKKLSDYAEHIKPGDEEFFENTKKEQLSAALSPTTRWRKIPLRLDDLAVIIVLLAPTVAYSDPATEAQIYFWAMLEAYRDYMKEEKPLPDGEVPQQLAIDMAFAFCRILVEGMDIAAETKLELQKAMDEIASRDKKLTHAETMLRDLLIEKHPRRPILTQKDAADACCVDEKTIRRWEKGNGTPDWYPGRNVTKVEMMARAREAGMQKRVARTRREGIKNAFQHNEERDRPADDD